MGQDDQNKKDKSDKDKGGRGKPKKKSTTRPKAPQGPDQEDRQHNAPIRWNPERDIELLASMVVNTCGNGLPAGKGMAKVPWPNVAGTMGLMGWTISKDSVNQRFLKHILPDLCHKYPKLKKNLYPDSRISDDEEEEDNQPPGPPGPPRPPADPLARPSHPVPQHGISAAGPHGSYGHAFMHPAGLHAPNAPMARPLDSFNRLNADRGQSLGLQGMHGTQSTGSRAAQTGSPTTRPSGPMILDRSGTPIPTYPVGPLSIRSGSSQSMRRSVTPSTHMRNVQRARREQEQENIDPRLLAQSGPWANPHANNQNFRNGPGNRNMLTPSSGNAGNHGGMSYGNNNNHQPIFGSGYGGTPTHGFGHGDNTAFNSYGNYGGPAPNPGLQYNSFNGGYQGNGFGGQYGGMGPGGPQQPGFMNGDFTTNYDGTPNLQLYDSSMQFNAPNLGASGPEHGYGDFGQPPSVPPPQQQSIGDVPEPQQQQAARDESPMQAFIEGPVPPLFDEYLERNNVQLQQLQQAPSAENAAAATATMPAAPVNEPAPAPGPAPAPAAPAGPATAPAGPTATPAGPATGPAPAPAGPAITPAGPAITPAGPVTTPAGPATTLAGPVTVPAGPAITPAGPVTAPAGPAPTPAGPAPAPTPAPAPAPAGLGFQPPPNLSSDQLYEWYTASGFAGQQQQQPPATAEAQGQGQKRKADDDDAREDDAKKQKRDDGAGGDGPGTGV